MIGQLIKYIKIILTNKNTHKLLTPNSIILTHSPSVELGSFLY